jgi:DNA polymerase-1
MEQAGVRIDLGALDSLSKRFAMELERVGERIFELAGRRFNINSPKQLGEVLFTHLGLPAPASRGKGKAVSTAQDVLEFLAEKHEVPRLVLEFRHLSKLKSTYIDALPLLADAESRVHTTFQAAAVATGRLSSINPNLQNIPTRTELGREIRAAFTAAPGTQLLSADYSQIELRLLAHFSGDPLLIHAYQNNEDIHADGKRGLRRAPRADGQTDAQPRQGCEFRHRLRHLALRAGRAVRHSAAGGSRLHRSLLRALRGRSCVH